MIVPLLITLSIMLVGVSSQPQVTKTLPASEYTATQTIYPEGYSSSRTPFPVLTTEDHLYGSTYAPTTIVVYVDFECPFCLTLHPTLRKLYGEYDGEIAVVYRHFPLAFHPQADQLANTAECIASLGGEDMFWKYTDNIFNKIALDDPTRYSKENQVKIAAELGIDQTAFNSCVQSKTPAPIIAAQQRAATKAGVNATPTMVIFTKSGHSEVLVGSLPYEDLKKAIAPYVSRGKVEMMRSVFSSLGN